MNDTYAPSLLRANPQNNVIARAVARAARSRLAKPLSSDGGIGKRTAGDSCTPLGTYPLGQPNRSTQYYIAISVGYPTREQVKRGYTGKDIAIHGPLRLHREANSHRRGSTGPAAASPSAPMRPSPSSPTG
jgi:hypothetical protein